MSYLSLVLMGGLLLGLAVVASNPSPYFAALGLVVVSGMGCGMMVVGGGSFLSLILFLIYLGGMLVVFAYSSALASDPYPESWGAPRVVSNSIVYILGVVLGGTFLWWDWYGGFETSSVGFVEMSVDKSDLVGVGVMYVWGGLMLLAGAWVLLLTLFVVLEVVRGSNRGTLRAV
nr:NADH dehydrogenase subunit 6 [Bryaninops yongei]